MKKGLLYAFIVIDLLVISICAFFLFQRLVASSHRPAMPHPMPFSVPSTMHPLPMMAPPGNRQINTSPIPGSSVVSSATSSMAVNSVSAAPVSAPPISNSSGKTTMARKILFAYRNSHAREVLIHADFLGWKGEPMQKDATNVWKYTATLVPGEYDYFFSVDARTIPDPANKRIKKIGLKKVSVITVKPLAVLPSHH